MCPALHFAPWPQSESRPQTLFHCHVQKHRVIRGFTSARCSPLNSCALHTRVLNGPVHLSDSARDHCCLIKQTLLPPKPLFFFQLTLSLTSGSHEIFHLWRISIFLLWSKNRPKQIINNYWSSKCKIKCPYWFYNDKLLWLNWMDLN